MAANTNLHKAKEAKNDEFYTQLTDVAKELMHYKHHFKDKVVFCNCDDPTWSAFWKYFHLNFAELGLKKLISTHYDRTEPTYKMEYYGGNDNDVEDGVKTPLEGNGDFRNKECLDLLDECDIVVTNGPFSLFRIFIATLMEHDKKFIVWSNNNAITYKEFFPLLKENKVWLGYTANKTLTFRIPDYYEKWDEKETLKINDGNHYAKVPAISVFTNLDIPKRHEKLILWKNFTPEEYPRYDNYLAWNVDKVAEIPCDDYIDVEIGKDELCQYMEMYSDLEILENNKIRIHNPIYGVPITFLDKYNPEQFEIVGLLQSSTDEQAGIPNLRYYNDFKEMRQNMSFTGASGGKANGNPVLKDKSLKGNFLFNPETKEYVHSVYARVVIKKRGSNNG